MIKCKECVKKDVCKYKEEGEKLWKDLALTPEFQKLEENVFIIDMECHRFKGEFDLGNEHIKYDPLFRGE